MTLVNDAPISVESLLDEYIAAIEEPREPDGKWHPSSYWGDCVRKIIYEVRGVAQTNPPDALSKRRFRIGHILHEFIQGALATAPELVKFYPEFEIESKLEAGHGDALAELVDGNWIVLEFKSARKTAFKFGLKQDHAKQGSSYAVRARTTGVVVDVPPTGPLFIPPLGEKLIGVLVVYFEKEDLNIREHWLPYDTAWEKRVDDRLEELEVYRADPESLPPRMPDKNKFPCSWRGGSCPFLDRCWNVDPASVPPVSATEVPEVFEW